MQLIIFLYLSQEVVFSPFNKACLLSSCIMYVLPPSCIAEPCEQEYSLPNMPLLFAIAMVGATIGGKLITLLTKKKVSGIECWLELELVVDLSMTIHSGRFPYFWVYVF